MHDKKLKATSGVASKRIWVFLGDGGLVDILGSPTEEGLCEGEEGGEDDGVERPDPGDVWRGAVGRRPERVGLQHPLSCICMNLT